MAANKIAFASNANMNEQDPNVAVLGKYLTLLLRAKRVVSICSSTTTMRSYIHRQLAEYNLVALHYNLPRMFDGQRQLHKYRCRSCSYVSKYQSQLVYAMLQNCKQSSRHLNFKHSRRKNRVRTRSVNQQKKQSANSIGCSQQKPVKLGVPLLHNTLSGMR